MVPSGSPWDIPGRLAAAARDGELEAAIEELVLVRILLETDFYGLAWEEMVGDPNAHRLSESAHRMSRGVSRFRRLWDAPDNRLWLAAAIGDWPSANELAQSHGDSAVKLVVAEKFESYRQRRLAIARFNLSLEPDSVDDLRFLFREGADDFNAYVNRVIETTGVNPALAGLLAETGDPQWNELLFAAFAQVSLDLTAYLSFELFGLAKPLLERGCHADDVLATLATQNQDLDRVALMFLKRAPAQALPIIRRALRHRARRACVRGGCCRLWAADVSQRPDADGGHPLDHRSAVGGTRANCRNQRPLGRTPRPNGNCVVGSGAGGKCRSDNPCRRRGLARPDWRLRTP